MCLTYTKILCDNYTVMFIYFSCIDFLFCPGHHAGGRLPRGPVKMLEEGDTPVMRQRDAVDRAQVAHKARDAARKAQIETQDPDAKKAAEEAAEEAAKKAAADFLKELEAEEKAKSYSTSIAGAQGKSVTGSSKTGKKK